MIDVAIVHWGLRQLARSYGFNLIAPGDPFYSEARDAVCAGHRAIRLAGAPEAAPGDELRVAREVSFTVPGVPVAGLLGTLPVVGAPLRAMVERLDAARPSVLMAPAAWDDPIRSAASGTHEFGHGLCLDEAAKGGGAAGAIGTAIWCIDLGAVPWFRLWHEGCQKTLNVQARVILGGEDVDVVIAEELAALRAFVGNDARVAERVLLSCALSLKAGELHGRGTPLHALLAILRDRGADLGRWNEKV